MEAAGTSETPPNFYQITRHNNPEGSHLHIRSRENLKYHCVVSLTLLSFTADPSPDLHKCYHNNIELQHI
jgi:hypothetical protein